MEKLSNLRQSVKHLNEPTSVPRSTLENTILTTILVFLTNSYFLPKHKMSQICEANTSQTVGKHLRQFTFAFENQTVSFLKRSLIAGSAFICHFMPKMAGRYGVRL